MRVFLLVTSIVLFILIVLFVWYYFFGDIGELKKAKKEFEIFGLKDGLVPQGLAYSPSVKKFFVSGYMCKKGLPSRIYVVDQQTYTLDKFVEIKLKSGKMYDGHAGGVAVFGNACWVCGEKKVFKLNLNDLLYAKNGEAVLVSGEFDVDCNADFCFVFDEHLWVGEFYKLGKFETDLTHHILLDDNTQSHALAFAYKISESSKLGVESVEPVKALAIPDLVQGITFVNGRFYVSCSYGLASSKIYEYENVLLKKTQNNIIIKQKNIKLWSFEKKYLKKTHVLPEMSEGIENVNGKVFVLFESGSKKYKMVTRTRINYIFSLK